MPDSQLVPLPPTCLENLAVWARQPYRDQYFQLCMTLLLRMLIIALHHQHIRYGVHEQQHEAGYDAFLTAQVFLALTAEMTGRGNSSEDHFPNGKSSVCAR
jgi:hypothetical protein